MSKPLFTPTATLSYPHLFEPTIAPGSDKAKYSCALVFDGDADLSELKAACMAAAEEKFGKDKVPALLRSNKLRFPFRDDGAEKGYPEGSTFINVRTDRQPGIVSIYPGPDGRPLPITDPKEIYAGCKVRASLRVFAYDVSGNKGVSFALGNIQKLAEGERLDGRRAAQDEFDADANAEAASLEDIL